MDSVTVTISIPLTVRSPFNVQTLLVSNTSHEIADQNEKCCLHLLHTFSCRLSGVLQCQDRNGISVSVDNVKNVGRQGNRRRRVNCFPRHLQLAVRAAQICFPLLWQTFRCTKSFYCALRSDTGVPSFFYRTKTLFLSHHKLVHVCLQTGRQSQNISQSRWRPNRQQTFRVQIPARRYGTLIEVFLCFTHLLQAHVGVPRQCLLQPATFHILSSSRFTYHHIMRCHMIWATDRCTQLSAWTTVQFAFPTPVKTSGIHWLAVQCFDEAICN